MTNIMCGVSSCYHYCDSVCTLGSINVSGKNAASPHDTSCKSFEESYSQAHGATSAASGSADPVTHIRCEANSCGYNRSGTCAATMITVAGAHAASSDQTECASFEKKR